MYIYIHVRVGRYTDAAHKAKQFPIDCHELATAQHIYANQLKALGVVDEVIWERGHGGGGGEGSGEGGVAVEKETYKDFPILKQRILSFITRSLATLSKVRNLPPHNTTINLPLYNTLLFSLHFSHYTTVG